MSSLCCRLRDSSITVAVDEAPDDGLEQPLRLEKLANEASWSYGFYTHFKSV